MIHYTPGGGVLPLPTDGVVPLRSEKWTLRGTHFLKTFAKIGLFINYFCEHHLPRFETLALKIKRKPADKSKQHTSHTLKTNQKCSLRVLFLMRVPSFQNEASDVRKNNL